MVLATLRRGGAALVAGLLAAGSLGWVAPAAAEPARAAAACTTTTGITVVVDFGTQGGGVQIRCVTQSVASGFEALRKAGFTYDVSARFGGLLCRIDGKPADDPCINAPPSDRYWAYWTAPEPGGTWTYSDQGAGNRVPPPGSVEGWAFSDGCDRKPGAGPCPPAPTTTTTTRPRTTTTTARPGGSSDPGPSTTVAGGGVGATGGSTSTTTTTGGGATSTTGGGDRAPASGERGDQEAVAIGGETAALVDGEDPGGGGGGSATGVVVVVLLALGLVAATVVTIRRRGADEAGP
jgi:hypothetical protein